MPVTERTATSLTLSEVVAFRSKLLLLVIVIVTCVAFLWALLYPHQVCAVYRNGSTLRPSNPPIGCRDWRDSTVLDRLPLIGITFGVAAIFMLTGFPSLLARTRTFVINRETSTVTSRRYPFIGKMTE